MGWREGEGRKGRRVQSGGGHMGRTWGGERDLGPGSVGLGMGWGGGTAEMVEVGGGERAGIRGNVCLRLSCPRHFREGVCK